MNRIYHELAGLQTHEHKTWPLSTTFAIAVGAMLAVALIAGNFLAGNRDLAIRWNMFPAAILGSMSITILFHVIRILGPNRNLRRLHRNWAEWRLAGVSPSKLMWALTRRGVLWGGIIAAGLIFAILTSLAPFKGALHIMRAPKLWIILFPGFVDMVFILVGGVFLDVAQWPRRYFLLRRISGQLAFAFCGAVPGAAALMFILLSSRPPEFIDPMGAAFVIAVISSVIRLIYIGHQWNSAIAALNADIKPPFQ